MENTDMTVIELEGMRLHILKTLEGGAKKDGNLLNAFASNLNELLREEGFTTSYPPTQKMKGSTVIVVEGPAFSTMGMAIMISAYFPHLINTCGYVDDSTVQRLVAGLRLRRWLINHTWRIQA